MTTEPRDAARAPGARWGVVYPVAGYIVAYLLGAIGASTVAGLQHTTETTLGTTLGFLLAFWAGLVGSAVVASRREGSGHVAADLGVAVRPRQVGVGVVAGLASQLALVPLLYLPLRWLDPDEAHRLDDAARKTIDIAHGAGRIVLVLAIAVGAPIVEELFFRGVLQGALVRRFGTRWGVLATAVAFGVTHGQLLQLAGLVAFGVVLGVLRERTGSLVPGIAAHIAFNAVTVVLLLR